MSIKVGCQIGISIPNQMKIIMILNKVSVRLTLYERFIIKNHFLALSLDDIPATIPLTKSQQQTYRLSTMVGR